MIGLEAKSRQLSSAFPPLLLAAQHIAQSLMPGLHGRKRAGNGGDFWQFRPFQQGDSAARIDWRKSARSDEVLLREREWAAPNQLQIWVQQDAGMNWKSDLSHQTKRERACVLALSLAILASEAGELIKLFGDGAKPGHTKSHLAHIAYQLEKADTSILRPVDKLPCHSTLLLFGDFLSESEILSRHLASLADATCKVHLIEIADPAEESLPWQGRAELRAMQGDAKLEFSAIEDLRETYTKARLNHRAKLRDLAHKLGFQHHMHRTDQSAAQFILTLYHALAQRPGA